MPVVNSNEYQEMLNRAKIGGFAYPALNVSSSQTLNAALAGLQEAGSDGILQVSTGGADYWSGSTIKNRVSGALAFAAFAREVAKNVDIKVALHTDHCAEDQLDGFVRPLLELSQEQVKSGGESIFNSHMWDGSTIALEKNLIIAKELLAKTHNVGAILEIEVGAVGGEEDGVEGAIEEHLYTTVEDGLKTIEALGLGENGRYISALTFGNVHGVYKPGNVHLRPELLAEIQREVGAQYGRENPFDLVFHGGSGSTDKEISDAVSFGVIKMNIDTDTQYAFTRPVVNHMLKNYDGVLRIDGEVGNKKLYDPRNWGAAAEAGMAARVIQAATQLGSAGKSSW
jgi:fructose-bisphosphate aldolase class II